MVLHTPIVFLIAWSTMLLLGAISIFLPKSILAFPATILAGVVLIGILAVIVVYLFRSVPGNGLNLIVSTVLVLIPAIMYLFTIAKQPSLAIGAMVILFIINGVAWMQVAAMSPSRGVLDAERARLVANGVKTPAVVKSTALTGIFYANVPLVHTTVEVRSENKQPYEAAVQRIGYPLTVGIEVVVYVDPADPNKLVIE